MSKAFGIQNRQSDGRVESAHAGLERFREAATTLAVAQLGNDAQLLDEVFAGVEYQRMRLRHDQRLEEWSGG